MDLFEKFSAVEVRPADCMTEADRQFFQRQQKIYQDAAEGRMVRAQSLAM